MSWTLTPAPNLTECPECHCFYTDTVGAMCPRCRQFAPAGKPQPSEKQEP